MRKFPLILAFGFLILVTGCAVKRNYGRVDLSLKDMLVDMRRQPMLTIDFCGITLDFGSYLGDEEAEVEARTTITEAHDISVYDLEGELRAEAHFSKLYAEDEEGVRTHFFHVPKKRLMSEGARFEVKVFNDSKQVMRICTRDVRLTR